MLWECAKPVSYTQLLCVDDYHRYSYVENGYLGPVRRINGLYHTVNPVAIEAGNDIYKENTRELSCLLYTSRVQSICVPM